MDTQREDIINQIKKVYDPEIPVNVWDLGLIYNIDISPDDIVIEMTFTSPTCPMMDDIVNQIKENVASVSNGKNVDVKLVWDPAWDVSKMSESARVELDLTENGW